MKKLIVLSAVLLAGLNLTSCDKKADATPATETVDSLAVETVTVTEGATATEGATVTEAATVTEVK